MVFGSVVSGFSAVAKASAVESGFLSSAAVPSAFASAGRFTGKLRGPSASGEGWPNGIGLGVIGVAAHWDMRELGARAGRREDLSRARDHGDHAGDVGHID